MHMIHNLHAVWLVKCVLLLVISVKKQYVPQENNTVIPWLLYLISSFIPNPNYSQEQYFLSSKDILITDHFKTFFLWLTSMDSEKLKAAGTHRDL